MPSLMNTGIVFEVEYLIVAGGGGGGAKANPGAGGGGGAGGLIYSDNFSPNFGSPYTITIGAGGVGGNPNGVPPTSGSNSLLSSITAFGGGRGACGTVIGNFSASSGGSGGGTNRGDKNILPGVVGQGNFGGWSSNTSRAGGGGGSATNAKLDTLFFTTFANGGDGRAIPITGTSIFYAGGGGGSSDGTTPSLGGGGIGTFNETGSNGVTNSGSGGGGGGGQNNPPVYLAYGGNGGSGIVVIAYKTTYKSASIGDGLTFTYSTSSRSGYHVYRFIGGTGTITFM